MTRNNEIKPNLEEVARVRLEAMRIIALVDRLGAIADDDRISPAARSEAAAAKDHAKETIRASLTLTTQMAQDGLTPDAKPWEILKAAADDLWPLAIIDARERPDSYQTMRDELYDMARIIGVGVREAAMVIESARLLAVIGVPPDKRAAIDGASRETIEATRSRFRPPRRRF